MTPGFKPFTEVTLLKFQYYLYSRVSISMDGRRLANWKTFLSNYHDNIVVDFLTYGWPINYTACTRPVSSSHNHPSAFNFDSHMQAYIDTELSYIAIVGPFNYPPFADDFVCSHVLRSYEPNLQSGKSLHFLPRSSFNPFLGSSRLSRRVSSLVDYLWPDSLTVFASASMQLVTGIPSPLLCFWTFNGGLSFFHAIDAFGILRVSIFPPRLAFKEAVPLVKRSASVLSSTTAFLCLLFI